MKDKKAVRADEVIPPQGAASIQVRQLAIDAAMMLPNLVKLLSRLLQDPRVPRRSKILLGASFAYVLSPIDLLPEFIPVAGLLDDIFLITFALNHLIERAGDEIVVEHWDGPQDLLGMIQSVLATVTDVIPMRIRRMMSKLAGE